MFRDPEWGTYCALGSYNLSLLILSSLVFFDLTSCFSGFKFQYVSQTLFINILSFNSIPCILYFNPLRTLCSLSSVVFVSTCYATFSNCCTYLRVTLSCNWCRSIQTLSTFGLFSVALVGQSSILIEYGQPLFVWLLRTYIRVYGLYGWGRGDYQKEGRGVSGVSCQVHIFYIGHSQYGQLTAVKTG